MSGPAPALYSGHVDAGEGGKANGGHVEGDQARLETGGNRQGLPFRSLTSGVGAIRLISVIDKGLRHCTDRGE